MGQYRPTQLLAKKPFRLQGVKFAGEVDWGRFIDSGKEGYFPLGSATLVNFKCSIFDWSGNYLKAGSQPKFTPKGLVSRAWPAPSPLPKQISIGIFFPEGSQASYHAKEARLAFRIYSSRTGAVSS